MSQFYLGCIRPLCFVSMRSETQLSSFIETTQAPYREVIMQSVGFLILLSSFILLCCSLKNWQPPATDPRSLDRQPPNKMSSMSQEPLFKIPCMRCHYFKANAYLACAVNPMQVLKPEAKSCPNFQPKQRHVSHDGYK